MSYNPQYPPDPYGQQPQGWPPPPAPPVVSGPPQPYSPPPQGYVPQQYPPGYGAPPPQKPKHNPVILAIGAFLALLIVVGTIGAIAAKKDEPATSTARPAGTGAKTTEAAPAADDGDDEQPADDDGKTFNLPVGTTITITGDDGSVAEGTLRSVKSFKSGCDSLNVDPKNGLYVVVDVVVQQKKGTGSVNPLDFTFVADDGTSNDALSSLFSGCDEPSLQSTNSLRAGQKRAGKIAFDVSSKKGTVEWAPGGLGADTVGSWKTS